MNLIGPHRYPLSITETINLKSIPDWVDSIAVQLLAAGHQAFLVGGAVRDVIREEAPKDWDIATDAVPERIEAIFARTVPTGKKYGTITVLDAENNVEVTTLREDIGYSDGRRPDTVRFSADITQDLARRDFTINAIAYDFQTAEWVDPFRGRDDLRRGILKAVGDPAIRFREDGLRMYRFYRFLATMNLKPDPATVRAINPDWAEPVSMERKRDELSKLLLGEWVRRGLSGLRDSGLLTALLPEFAAIVECRTQGSSHRWPLWEHIILATETIRPELPLRLAALFHDIAKPNTRFEDDRGVHFYGHDLQGATVCTEILQRLRYPKTLLEKVSHLIRWHMFSLPSNCSDAAVRRLIYKVGPEEILDLMELRRADIVATGRVDRAIWEYWNDTLARLEAILAGMDSAGPHLAVNGRDLIRDLRLESGPLLGQVLNHLKDAVIDDPTVNDRTTLIYIAQKYLEELKN